MGEEEVRGKRGKKERVCVYICIYICKRGERGYGETEREKEEISEIKDRERE